MSVVSFALRRCKVLYRTQILPPSIIQRNWCGKLLLSIIVITIASTGILGSSSLSSFLLPYRALAEQGNSMHHAQAGIIKQSPGDEQLANFSINRTITGLENARKSEIIDTDANGTILQIEAKPVAKSINGTVIRMYGYNGEIPGPLIKVKQDSSIYVNFTNNLDVETTVHWHGVRVENRNDGVPGITQAPIQPGETFLYKLDFPDEGVYWYHSHSREDVQVELGLYGNILVQPKSENNYNPVNREVALFLDDIRISSNGDVDIFSKDHEQFSLMGRFGNIMLLNGDTDYQLNVKKGEVVRFFLTDSANTRIFNFSIDGHEMKLVGGDGGKYLRESFVDSVIFAPAERYIVEVLFDKAGTFRLLHTTPGKTYTLGVVNVIPKTSGQGSSVKGQDFSSFYYQVKTNEELTAQHALLFKKYLFAKPDYQLNLTVEMEGMNHDNMNHEGGGMSKDMIMEDIDMTMTKDMDMTMTKDMDMTMTKDIDMASKEKNPAIEPVEWDEEEGSADAKMNSLSTNKNTRWILKDNITGKENRDINYQMKVGDFNKIRLFNDPNSPHPMQHPIHIHGLHFLVLSEDGKANDNFVWKDVVLVPRGSTVDILLSADNPGKWDMHCHILEHSGAGMTTILTVKD